MAEPVSAACFFTANVSMMGMPLPGGWTKVDGMGMKVETTEKEEGGNPFFKRLLINRISYPEVTLTRPVDQLSAMLRTQIAGIATKFLPVQAEIVLMTSGGDRVSSWELLNATITNYKAPSFGITNTGIAEESITIHHQGFLEGFMAAIVGSMGAVGV